MALTDTFIRQVKHSGAPAGDKHSDGQGLFLLINAVGKYWRMNYRFTGKQKTLALGVYPAVSLAKARQRRDKARELLADDIDPGQAKRDDKQAKADAAAHTFEVVARTWLVKTAGNRAASTQEKVTGWLEKKVFPAIGNKPISTVGPRDVLAIVQKMEAHGHNESAHRVKQICGQVFRYAVATGAAERDVTA
ncbi:MAG TPA: integrase arm-type DNA-binding domain-containing protein, partial [Burkholderiaceae bacterium]|nr:integrase arm-type DNA-binding domain-containing protein [Burkholderiaceae bacterium]